MYISRELENEILDGAKNYPVVTLTGPRQSGKTTLLRRLFPEKKYYSLENPITYDLAVADPVRFLETNGTGVILDEVQKVPGLLSFIQGIVDETNQPGQYILSGSQQFNLMSGITQSLAGRTALYTLFPFTMKELGSLNENDDGMMLYKGFYPRIWDTNSLPTKGYLDYLETYIQRDLRQLVNVKDLNQFRSFVKLCAGRTGQIFVASHLANELGVSVHTINSWLSILETSYIVFQLSPYHTNINKRLVKARKIYFYDTGLVCAILGIQQPEYLSAHPLFGQLFENMVVAEIVKSRKNQGLLENYFFYRDSNQNEVDLIFDHITHLDAVEIKSTKTFNQGLLGGLNYIRKIFPEKIRQTILCCAGNHETDFLDHRLVNFRNISNVLSSLKSM